MHRDSGSNRIRAAVLALSVLLAGCAGDPAPPPVVAPPPEPVAAPAPLPAPAPRCIETVAYDELGRASWYGEKYHGRTTASGDVFDMEQMTAAHRVLPFGTPIKVTNLDNGRSVTLVVNDRGPFVRGRVVDVSRRAATDLGFLHAGLARVRVTASSCG
jgi:rare lipoprotein A